MLLNKSLKVLFCIVIVAVCVSIILMTKFWFQQRSKQEVFGVSFSQVQAERYGSDWRANYIALLDELSFKHLRVAAYWDRIQPNPHSYDWVELDYMVAEAKKRNAKLTVVVGQKVIRVPECYYPKWLNKQSTAEVQQAETVMLKELIKRYKNESTIEAWQVENEFLLRSFGDCPKQNLTKEVLHNAVETVKSVDNTRPIIITQSDQIGWPVRGPFGDVFGFSMYRWVWSPLGYYMYPQSGIYNWWKAAIISTYTNQDTKVHELQAEPWDYTGNENLDYQRSLQTMNPVQLMNNIEYARQTQMKRIDLWGSEWWYAMHKQGYNEMWQAVQALPNKE